MCHNYRRMSVEMEFDRSNELSEDGKRVSNVKEDKIKNDKYRSCKKIR